ncbi:MAG TPA: PIG-L family deacetylase [Thermoanaerobaculia bacterium]|nr:PIG-L family deacetylase [Thermoanaerobaculia bacterium]
MIEEEKSIPFAPARLEGEKILVLAPHPDDEVIGCGGVIALLAAEKREVHVVVATDGAAAEDLNGRSVEAYRALREEESRRGLAHLGVTNLAFLRFPDRSLTDSEPDLAVQIEKALREIRPDLVLAPSPLEIHPDHITLSRALFRAVQAAADYAGDLALTRVAFYEVSRPLRPNRLVDITSVAEKKFEAIAMHQSQTSLRDYAHFARGLNAYRAMTLPESSQFAEAYFERPLLDFRTMSWNALTSSLALHGSPVEVIAEPLPITVLIRTRNRLALLEEAIASVAGNTHPSKVIVINDGGESPAAVVSMFPGVKLIENQASLGRSEAMNVGARSAAPGYLAFLDDDDLYYPDHLEVLARAARRKTHIACYTDALSVFFGRDATGGLERQQTLRLYAHDFDPDLLLVENYIPLPTLLVGREDFLETGGFDRRFDLFEDWDFLIRLSRRGSLQRIPAVTCEIRHIEGVDSAILSSPAGSARYSAARLKVWEKHSELLSPQVFATALEKQKGRIVLLEGTAVDSQGRARHLELDVARLQREKGMLLHELEAANADRHVLRSENARLFGSEAAIREAMKDIEEEIKYQHRENERLTNDVSRVEKAVADQSRESAALLAEINRLNVLLKTIYASKAWRLHTLVQRVKGAQ